MKQVKLVLPTLLLPLVASSTLCAQTSDDRPNILWLTFEDSSDFLFSCYGNKNNPTPIVDGLAKNGYQFMKTSSVAPQSSPARSSLATGCYSTTYSMDMHRINADVPDSLFFAMYLRKEGYYCTNNKKTDYNTLTDLSRIWDENGDNATYNSPKRGNKPFFSVFNSHAPHSTCVRTIHTHGRRDFKEIGMDIQKIAIPGHLPDIFEVRSDMAVQMDYIRDIDSWVGLFLKDLKNRGLDKNTIIFVFGDGGGGAQMRGKSLPYETGLRVPFVVYLPKKWQHLSSYKKGSKINDLVDFTDFGPTVLSMVGICPPKFMQGQAFMGKYDMLEPKKYQFGFNSSQLHHVIPARTVFDGRYKYIRNYIPYKQNGLRNYHLSGIPSYLAIDQLNIDGKLDQVGQLIFDHLPVEGLYDLQNDPSEIHNLANDVSYAEKLKELRLEVSKHIRNTSDLGFFLPNAKGNGVPLYDRVRQAKYPLAELYDLVEAVGFADMTKLQQVQKYLTNTDVTLRYWATVVFAQAAVQGVLKESLSELKVLMKDKDMYVAAEACFAQAYLGNEDSAISQLLSTPYSTAAFSLLECLSLDKNKHSYFNSYIPVLEFYAKALPCKSNEDTGLMARGVLANLGLMKPIDIFGSEAYELGLKMNQIRRKHDFYPL